MSAKKVKLMCKIAPICGVNALIFGNETIHIKGWKDSHATRKNNIGTCDKFDWQHCISPTKHMGLEKKNMFAPNLGISLPKMAIIMFSQHDADGVRMAME